MTYARIIGTGSYFPEGLLTNADLEKMVDTTDEWITSRTGIRVRHVAAKDEMTSDLAYRASKNAIEMAGIKADEIDGIIFPTVTPDQCFPSCADVLQNKLGFAGSFAFDLNATCSGFVYSLSLADALIKSGRFKTILIAAAERLTTITDYTDRNSCILFGDGAGSVIVRADNTPGIRSFDMGADGSGGDVMYMKGMGSAELVRQQHGESDGNSFIAMKGNEVFKRAVPMMADSGVKALSRSGLTGLEDIDWVLPHQANYRIIKAVSERLNVDMDKMLVNIETHGNVSAATIPALLDENIRNGKIKPCDNLLLCAFGGGWTWGASVLSL
ncbi:3-oxoacyl-[acyl-carrier-protein] synthase 3 [Deferribacterales bacterium]|nr:3-oxoacyl-[acyl-carrier-protein] synthase 3 [Deferribacterales bacterium]